MTYIEFKRAIQSKLKKSGAGLTWNELKNSLGLPYERPCPEWTRRLETEIGLIRQPGSGRALVWTLKGLRSRAREGVEFPGGVHRLTAAATSTPSPDAASSRTSRARGGRLR